LAEELYKEEEKSLIKYLKGRKRNKLIFFTFEFTGLTIVVIVLLFLIIYNDLIPSGNLSPGGRIALFCIIIISFIQFLLIIPELKRIKLMALLKITTEGIYPPLPRNKKLSYIPFKDIDRIKLSTNRFSFFLKNGKVISINREDIGDFKKAQNAIESVNGLKIEK
jgi:hypothetical protein